MEKNPGMEGSWGRGADKVVGRLCLLRRNVPVPVPTMPEGLGVADLQSHPVMEAQGK